MLERRSGLIRLKSWPKLWSIKREDRVSEWTKSLSVMESSGNFIWKVCHFSRFWLIVRSSDRNPNECLTETKVNRVIQLPVYRSISSAVASKASLSDFFQSLISNWYLTKLRPELRIIEESIVRHMKGMAMAMAMAMGKEQQNWKNISISVSNLRLELSEELFV